MAEEVVNSSGGEIENQNLVDREELNEIAELNKERKEMEQSGKFLECERVKDMINQSGEKFYRRKLMDLKNKHQAEKDQ